jgi:hypothetical protein
VESGSGQADRQLLGDLGIAQALDHQGQYLLLTIS